MFGSGHTVDDQGSTHGTEDLTSSIHREFLPRMLSEYAWKISAVFIILTKKVCGDLPIRESDCRVDVRAADLFVFNQASLSRKEKYKHPKRKCLT
jgi:hypothetical protein